MLATLFAHEVRTLGRRTLTILGLFSAIGLSGIVLSLIPAVSAVGAAIAFVAFSVAPVVITVLLFVGYWQSMYGTRGYLTFMLPVRGRTIFLAKVLHIILMCFVSAGVTSLGFCLLSHTHGVRVWLEGHPFQHEMRVWQEGHGHSGYDESDWMQFEMGHGMHALAILVGVLGVAGVLILIASIMSITARSRWSHLGFAAPVIGFIVWWVLGGLAGAVGAFILPMGIRNADGAWVWQGMWGEIHHHMEGPPEVIGLGYLPVYAVIICASAVWAVRTIERHTSLR